MLRTSEQEKASLMVAQAAQTFVENFHSDVNGSIGVRSIKARCISARTPGSKKVD